MFGRIQKEFSTAFEIYCDEPEPKQTESKAQQTQPRCRSPSLERVWSAMKHPMPELKGPFFLDDGCRPVLRKRDLAGWVKVHKLLPRQWAIGVHNFWLVEMILNRKNHINQYTPFGRWCAEAFVKHTLIYRAFVSVVYDPELEDATRSLLQYLTILLKKSETCGQRKFPDISEHDHAVQQEHEVMCGLFKECPELVRQVNKTNQIMLDRSWDDAVDANAFGPYFEERLRGKNATLKASIMRMWIPIPPQIVAKSELSIRKSYERRWVERTELFQAMDEWMKEGEEYAHRYLLDVTNTYEQLDPDRHSRDHWHNWEHPPRESRMEADDGDESDKENYQPPSQED